MCLSRLYRVRQPPRRGWVEVEDAEGAATTVALLALDGPLPEPGDWLVVHSGYAIDRADPGEAEQVVAEIRAGLGREQAEMEGAPAVAPAKDSSSPSLARGRRRTA